jgi:hypothetical protein
VTQTTTILGLDARVWQAFIAGAVVALGWLVNGWQNRRDAARLRRERLRDAHKALYAEIRYACATFWGEGEAEADGRRLIARMRGEPGFVPFVPREADDRVYDAMLPQIDVLPRQTIDAIVAFYAVLRAIGALAEDMRGARFAQLDPERRIAIYADYLAMRRRAFDYGQHALALIEAYASGGREGAERTLARLNAPRPTPDQYPGRGPSRPGGSG